MQWTPAARAELSIQEQGSAVQRAGASEREGTSEHMDRTSVYEGTRAQLAFVVWLCRSRDPSTRARRMRHRDRRQRKHSKHSRGGGKGTAVKVQDVDGWLSWYL